MDDVLKPILDVIAAGGNAAIWIAMGWFAHKILFAWAGAWVVVRVVSKITDCITARVNSSGFAHELIVAAGMRHPLSHTEKDELLKRVAKAGAK